MQQREEISEQDRKAEIAFWDEQRRIPGGVFPFHWRYLAVMPRNVALVILVVHYLLPPPDDDGWVLCQVEDLRHFLHMSLSTQGRALNKAEQMKLIETDWRGLPPRKRYVRIDSAMIFKLLDYEEFREETAHHVD